MTVWCCINFLCVLEEMSTETTVIMVLSQETPSHIELLILSSSGSSCSVFTRHCIKMRKTTSLRMKETYQRIQHENITWRVNAKRDAV